MKRFLSMILALSLILSLASVGSANAEFKVYIDGELQTYDQPPTVINGSTLVPLRGIFEALGASVNYESATKTVTGIKGDTTIVLVIGAKTANINGASLELAQAGQLVNGRTLVPLRFVGEALGAKVNYEGSTKTITITSVSGTGESDTPEYNGVAKVEVSVTRVIDGDTIEVKFEEKTEKVRLIGVDTPETVHPEKGEQPFGKEASNYTKSRLDGNTIELEFDIQERDQYGRLLAYVWIGSEHFNATLLKEGYAVLSTWPPNVKYVDEFTKYQTQAREAKKGLWGIAEISNQYRVGNYEINPDTGLPLQKININTATKVELQLIPGIGETLADRIIEYRKTNKFTKPEDLTKISGIGATSVEKMIPYVTVE